MNYKQFLRPLAAILCCAAAILTATAQNDFGPLQKLSLTERIIESYYVNPVNADSIVEQGIRAMLKTLDPHSTYSTPEETKALTEPLLGNFSGIGIQFNMLTDTLYVLQTVAGGPSEKVGILAGDRIMTVNDTLIAGQKMNNDRIMKMLRGPKDTQVRVKVKRNGVPELIQFVITRDDIPINSVDAAYMAAPGVGYVRVVRFAETTGNEVKEAIKELRKQGMKDLIIDLESNGGGYLEAAFDMASMFLGRDVPVVSTGGANSPARQYFTKSDGILTDGRLVVMVDQYSASASEILSGAVQDNDRGLIVGRRTFGKGLVQRPFPFPDGSMIRLTTAHYYTPSGRSIQKPYTTGDDDEYSSDISRRLSAGELTSADSLHPDLTQRYETLRLNRPVYGGGGIIPDQFVPLDTAFFTPYYRDLMAKGIYNRYTQQYVDLNRKALLKQYKNVEAFVRQFVITDAMMADMAALGEREGVSKPDEPLSEATDERIRIILKALIARDLYDQTAYFKVINEANPTYREALELITGDRYRTLLPG